MATLLGISRALAYDAVPRGEAPSIRIGRHVLVFRIDLDRLVNVTMQPMSPTGGS